MSSKKSIPLLFVVVLLIYQAVPLFGQTPSLRQPEVKTDLASALRVLRPLVRNDPQRAISMLLRLKEEYPTNSQVLSLLGDTYQVVGDVELAIASYEECLRSHPTHIQAGASLGMLYVQIDDREKAESVFDDLLDKTEHGVNTYRTIASTLSRHGYFDLALGVYQDGREVNKGNYILTLDLAYLFKTMGQYDASLREYLYLIETAPKQHRLAKTKVLDLLREPSADTDELLVALVARSQEDTRYRSVVLGILATVYLERGMLENSLDAALQAEQFGKTDGRVLFELADQAVKEYESRSAPENSEYFNLGLRALEAYLDGYPASQHVPRARLMLADLLVDYASGRIEGAPVMALEAAVGKSLDALDWIIASFPGTEHAEQAYLKKGDVVFRIQKQPEQALAIYKMGMSKARFYPSAFAERLGRTYLVIEEYDQAQSHFGKLVRSDSQELRETGVFYSGLLLCLTRQYEAARDTLTALAESNPASQFTNDAIHIAWLVEEGLQGEQKVLHRYVDALHAELAADTALAINELKAIVELPADVPLRSRALLKLGEIYQSAHANQAALDTYGRFVREYPADPLRPDVHRKIGQVYERGFGDDSLALETYENILVAYPYYIFLDEVRYDVNRLRGTLGE